MEIDTLYERGALVRYRGGMTVIPYVYLKKHTDCLQQAYEARMAELAAKPKKKGRR